MATLFVSSLGLPGSAASPYQPAALKVESLKQLFPIRDLPEEELENFAVNRAPEVLSQGSLIFKRGQPIDSIIYLLGGTVEVKPADGGSYRIEAGSTRAKFPLESGVQHITSAIAASDIEVLRVCTSVMSCYSSRQSVVEPALDRHDPGIPATVRASRLFQAFSHHFGDGSETELLPLPGISAQVNRILREQAGNAELGRVLAWDPILSSRLVHLANSPLKFGRDSIDNCAEAINIMGRDATLRLLVSTCARRTDGGRHPWVRQGLKRFWKTSVFRAAICQILAYEAGLDPHTAQLAGLVADIGELPFLRFADTVPATYWSDQDAEGALPSIRRLVGPVLLRRSNFPTPLAGVPALARSWYADIQPQLVVHDMVILANVLMAISGSNQSRLPAFEQIPAWQKFGSDRLTPERTLQILSKAKQKLASRGLHLLDPLAS